MLLLLKTSGKIFLKNNDKAIEHMQIAVDIWKDADKEFSVAQDAKSKLEEWSS